MNENKKKRKERRTEAGTGKNERGLYKSIERAFHAVPHERIDESV